jgi:hypothetical protein
MMETSCLVTSRMHRTMQILDEATSMHKENDSYEEPLPKQAFNHQERVCRCLVTARASTTS